MPDHKGFIASLTADGKAEVVIRPDTPGIPNAPEVSARVCHCATDGSTVRIEALNMAGAGVGDWVSVSHGSGILMKNVAVLLGIPVLGGISGLAAGAIFTGGLAVHVTNALIFTSAGLFLGIIIGAAVYRRLSPRNQPVISRVIRSRTEMDSLFNTDRSCSQNEDVSCRSCIERLP